MNISSIVISSREKYRYLEHRGGGEQRDDNGRKRHRHQRHQWRQKCSACRDVVYNQTKTASMFRRKAKN